MNDRDTHFANAAKLLMEELDIDPVNDLTQLIIAHFAYDVARHVVSETMGGTPNAINIILASYVSDLTSWPDTSPQ